MTQLKWCLLSAVLVLCCDLGATQMNERFGLNPRHSIEIDRFAPNHDSAGYFLLPVDKTAFSVDRPVWMREFDIAKVFLYDPVDEKPVHNVPVRIKFVKIANHTLGKDAPPAEVVFVSRAVLNSTHETRVKVLAKVPLHPGFTYEIRLKMPEKVNFMYNDFLDIRDYKIDRFFGKTITVSFYLHNPIVNPPNSNDHRRKISHGMIKRIHFIYSWF